MIALRYLYVLALVVWLGGMVTLGGVVAPSTFQVLEARQAAAGRVMAGAVFGDVLRRFHVLAYVAGSVMLAALVAMRLIGPRPPAFGLRAVLVAVMLGIAAYSGLRVSGRIEHLQREIRGSVSALAESDPRRREFDRLHGLSTTLMTVNMLAGLVLLYWQTRD